MNNSEIKQVNFHEETLQEVPINKIKVLENSRIRIEETELVSLMKDIKYRGLLQPISLIKTKEGEYILRFGQRRLEACKKLKYNTISAIVSSEELSPERFISDNLAENMERIDLTPIEFARICRMLVEDNYAIGEISVILNQPTTKIKTALRLAQKTPEEFKGDIRYIGGNSEKKGKLSATTASKIIGLRIKDAEIRELMGVAKKQDLSSRDIAVIGALIQDNNCSVNQAIEKRKEYKIVSVSVAMRLEELIKYKSLKNTDLIKGFINGKISPNKELVK